MKIYKCINNNIVSSIDESGYEVIVFGKGIGFKAKENAEIPNDKIEKLFRIDSNNSVDKIKQLLKDIPDQYFELVSDIIAYADKYLGKKLNQNIYFTLTDHIYFAVQRLKEGYLFNNALLYDVKRFHKPEFSIAKYALVLIEERMKIKFSDGEAAAIALHILNAEYEMTINMAMNVTSLLSVAVKIINEHFDITVDEESSYFERFATHLKFLMIRASKNEVESLIDNEMCEMIQNTLPKEVECSQKVADYMNSQYGYQLSHEEVCFLAIHIKKVRSR